MHALVRDSRFDLRFGMKDCERFEFCIWDLIRDLPTIGSGGGSIVSRQECDELPLRRRFAMDCPHRDGELGFDCGDDITVSRPLAGWPRVPSYSPLPTPPPAHPVRHISTGYGTVWCHVGYGFRPRLSKCFFYLKKLRFLGLKESKNLKKRVWILVFKVFPPLCN